MMKLELTKKEIIVTLGVAASLVWAGWVTKELAASEDKIVRLGAASIIQEYMNAAARSSWSETDIKQKTEAFTDTLDDLIAAEAAKGSTVLMSEAVLSKDAEDITPRVREALIKKVGWPAQATRPAPMRVGR
jgi:hypothetical protein